MDGYSGINFADQNFKTLSLYEIRDDGQPAFMSRGVENNQSKLTKPFEIPSYSGHFNFSYGHFLKNAGYMSEYENTFSWEEPF